MIKARAELSCAFWERSVRELQIIEGQGILIQRILFDVRRDVHIYACVQYVCILSWIYIKSTALTCSAVTPSWCISYKKRAGNLLLATAYLSPCQPALQQQFNVTAISVSSSYGQPVHYMHVWNHHYATLILILKASCNFSNM